jgi:AAA15 family ATPase/GTPase
LSNENQPRLLSFTLDGWDVLGGKVSVSLSDRVAVLVGQNGAGKSAILEGFEAIALRAANSRPLWRFGPVRQIENMPKVLDVEILAPNNRQLNYHYEIVLIPVNEEENNLDLNWPHQESLSWNDSCQYADEQQEKLWETKNGWTDFGKGKEPVTLGNTSSFENYYRIKKSNLPVEMQWVVSVLWGVSIIVDTLPNQLLNRASSQLKTIDGIQTASGLADLLTLDILNLQSKQKLPEFESICRRIGLADKITIEKFFHQGSSQEKSTRHISSVSLDNVNIGLLSDGTLRILSILLKIVRASPTATTIIEEPEMQIHPGMLSKLLNEIESYTFGENLIISTHSPQIVSWAKSHQINLIHRNHDRILVRKLNPEETHRVVEYLNEEGDLGDWIYSGILDDE